MSGSNGTARTERINGIEMYCELQGEGKPLLLLHGFTGSGADWGLVFPGPPEGYRLVIPDLRGHGRSTNPSAEFTFRHSALDVLALLDRLDIDRCLAIGLSAGAKTLLHMATRQAGRIDRMVLVSAAPYFPERARLIMRQLTVESRTEAEWQLMRQQHPRGDEQIRALWKQAHAFKDSYEDLSFTPPLLATITARTLIVHGDRDPFYPLDLALQMHAAIPRAVLTTVRRWARPGQAFSRAARPACRRA